MNRKRQRRLEAYCLPVAMPIRSAFAIVLLLPLAGGCSLAKSAVVGFVYDDADLPASHVQHDLAYRDTGHPKHRLNLFLPLTDSVRAQPWPVVVFVHGGGWTTGDKDFRFGYADVYNNVGRFLATRGIGAATINYRLMPEVTWREQVADVAAAVAYLRQTVGSHGGNPDAVFLMGHSAGAYLASYVALDRLWLEAEGVPASAVCGAIPVSGAALDLTDRATYLLEDNFDYYAARFAPDRVPRIDPPPEPFAWQVEASPVRHVRADAPPFLMLYAGGETQALQRQSRLLAEALQEAGAHAETVVVPGKSHERIVPTLSRDDQTAGPALVRFVRTAPCGG